MTVPATPTDELVALLRVLGQERDRQVAGLAQVSDRLAHAIHNAAAAGLSYAAIADATGLHKSRVGQIIAAGRP